MVRARFCSLPPGSPSLTPSPPLALGSPTSSTNLSNQSSVTSPSYVRCPSSLLPLLLFFLPHALTRIVKQPELSQLIVTLLYKMITWEKVRLRNTSRERLCIILMTREFALSPFVDFTWLGLRLFGKE